MLTEPGRSNGASKRDEHERWRELGAHVDRLSKERAREAWRNLDPLKTGVVAVGVLLGAGLWLFVIWLLIQLVD